MFLFKMPCFLVESEIDPGGKRKAHVDRMYEEAIAQTSAIESEEAATEPRNTRKRKHHNTVVIIFVQVWDYHVINIESQLQIETKQGRFQTTFSSFANGECCRLVYYYFFLFFIIFEFKKIQIPKRKTDKKI